MIILKCSIKLVYLNLLMFLASAAKIEIFQVCSLSAALLTKNCFAELLEALQF